MVRARFSYLHAVALRLVVRSALLPLRTIAADPANLKGTWRIASQSSFKPEGGAIPFTAEGRKRDQVKGDIDQFDYDTARCASPVCRG